MEGYGPGAVTMCGKTEQSARVCPNREWQGPLGEGGAAVLRKKI